MLSYGQEEHTRMTCHSLWLPSSHDSRMFSCQLGGSWHPAPHSLIGGNIPLSLGKCRYCHFVFGMGFMSFWTARRLSKTFICRLYWSGKHRWNWEVIINILVISAELFHFQQCFGLLPYELQQEENSLLLMSATQVWTKPKHIILKPSLHVFTCFNKSSSLMYLVPVVHKSLGGMRMLFNISLVNNGRTTTMRSNIYFNQQDLLILNCFVFPREGSLDLRPA